MNPQDDNSADDRFRNPQSPDPIDNSPQGSDVNDTLSESQSIPADQDIAPDPNLQTYQDDINTGEQEDRVHYEQHSDKPADILGMPEEDIKSEFDNTAMSEQEYSPDQHDGQSDSATDDTREHIEDMDEADKERSTDGSWTDRAA